MAEMLLRRWHHRPDLFAEEALGLRLWGRQREILLAIAKHPRVAVRSGQKIGKSISIVVIALWWFCTRPRARVILTSASYRQVKSILWKELCRLHRESKIPIGGRLAEAPETGLQLDDGREIVGFSTDKPERMAGISGENVLFLPDEASGILEPIFEAIEGNRAGGARVAMFSNPTQTSGTFYDAFHDKREFWHTIHISSEETPNVLSGQALIPGLAGRDWIEEKKREWGEDSPLYAVRVRGDFPRQGQNSIVPVAYVEDAVQRWETTKMDGRLHLGVDVARFGDDETVITARRGQRVFMVYGLSSMDGPHVAGEVLRAARELSKAGDFGSRERPLVKVDVIGVGASAYDVLVRSSEVEAVAVNVAEAATTEDAHNLRSQLWMATRDWLKQGGAIPQDSKLEGELAAARYGFDTQGRLQVEKKEEMKKRLRRSPDRADSLALSIYTPPVVQVQRAEVGRIPLMVR